MLHKIKMATDIQIIQAYEKAFKEKDIDISHQLAFFVIKAEFDRRKLNYDDVRL